MKHVPQKKQIIKRDISSENIDTFKFLLENIKWVKLLRASSQDKTYETFHFIFSDTAFSKKEIEIKTQYLQSPQITRVLQKSSKRVIQSHPKSYLYEKIKKKSKTSYYQRQLKLFEGDIKKTWKIIKEVIGKKIGTFDSFPKKLVIDKVEITDTKTIAKTFSNFFAKSWPNLASKSPKSDTNVEVHISKANTKLLENPLTEDVFLEGPRF